MKSIEQTQLLDDIFEKINIKFEKENTKKDTLELQKEKELNSLENISVLLEKNIKKKIFLQKCSSKGKLQAETIIENVNNRMLKYIFPYNIKFDIEQKISGGITYVYCFTEIDKEKGLIRREPTEGGGLGVVDTISIATRNIFLNEVDKNNKAPIFFDEPGKFISSEYISKIAEYLQTTQSFYKRQMFLITHNDFISNIGDKAFIVTLNDSGYSVVNEI